VFLIAEEEINGDAFKSLSIEELKEMGFKTGPRKNIMTIIETCTVTLEVRVLSIGCMNDNYVAKPNSNGYWHFIQILKTWQCHHGYKAIYIIAP
jgi:hypothetical protein